MCPEPRDWRAAHGREVPPRGGRPAPPAPGEERVRETGTSSPTAALDAAHRPWEAVPSDGPPRGGPGKPVLGPPLGTTHRATLGPISHSMKLARTRRPAPPGTARASGRGRREGAPRDCVRPGTGRVATTLHPWASCVLVRWMQGEKCFPLWLRLAASGSGERRGHWLGPSITSQPSSCLGTGAGSCHPGAQARPWSRHLCSHTPEPTLGRGHGTSAPQITCCYFTHSL